MKRFLQFVCCVLVYLLVVLDKDSCGEARRSPFNSEKDSTSLQKKKIQHLGLSKVESGVAEFQPSSKKNVEKEILVSENNGGGGGSDPKTKTKNPEDILAEDEQVRELVDHVDYAGATTHPPSEPPKKKNNSNKKRPETSIKSTLKP